MGSGSQIHVGAVLGTGASLAVNKPGFKPSFVALFNADDPAFGFYFNGMPDGYVAKHTDSTTSYATSNGLTLSEDGFTIGADTDLNVSGEQLFYVCWR